MTPDRWARMKEIFSAALEAPEAERNGYLESACGEDAELRAEIERLLAAERHSDLRSPVSGIWRQPEALSKGAMLGGYRIKEKLGEGGMGVVYAAEDMRLHRVVALKILPQATALDPELMREIRISTHGGYAIGDSRFREEIESTLNRRAAPHSAGRPGNCARMVKLN